MILLVKRVLVVVVLLGDSARVAGVDPNSCCPSFECLGLALLVPYTLQAAVVSVLDSMSLAAEESIVRRKDLAAVRDGAHARGPRVRLCSRATYGMTILVVLPVELKRVVEGLRQ